MSVRAPTRRLGIGARRAAAASVVGGALISWGAALPWLSLFAGLHTYSGLVGLYGRVLFLGGALVAAGGAAMLVRSDRWLRPAVGTAGVAQALFATWLLVGLRATLHDTSGMHAMVVARAGPGLFVVLAGAVLVGTALAGREVGA